MTEQVKIALVTGAGSGIGKAAALALLAEGWSVVLAGRRVEKLEAAVAQAGADGARAIAVQADVADSDSVEALFARTRERFGRLDLLFNNAGIGAPPILLEDLTVEQWRSVVDTNLNGAFFCLQAAFRIMKAQKPVGGRIVNNGSISAHVPRPNSAPYTATKHAMTGLTRAASLDGRKYDIAVGNTASELTERMRQGVPQANGTIMQEPVMDVAHVARAIVQMAALPLDANVQFMTKIGRASCRERV